MNRGQIVEMVIEVGCALAKGQALGAGQKAANRLGSAPAKPLSVTKRLLGRHQIRPPVWQQEYKHTYSTERSKVSS